MVSNDDSAPFDAIDAFAAFASPADPLDAHLDDPTPGTLHLLAARDLLRDGDPAHALVAMGDARAAGIPADLVPGARAVEASALVLEHRADEAVDLLRTAWTDHPDVAILPAVLGIALERRGGAGAAARALHAALASDDPDGSLAVHRWLLTRLLP